MHAFAETGLPPVILSALDRLELVTPTPIQEKAIPVVRTGSDLIGIAQTGTGKTLAFSLPLIERLLNESGKGVIIVPTRELALQVEESIRKVTRFLDRGPRTISLIGGTPIYRQIRDLRQQNPRIIIATPGRLQDHLDQRTLHLNDTKVLVLDEADRMFDMGFAPQIKKIMAAVPEHRQTLLFSATMPPEIAALASHYMNNPVRVEVARQGTSAAQIAQEICYVSHDSKPAVLEKLLNEHPGSILVFSRTKHGANKLSRRVQEMGHRSAEIHSNKSLSQRKAALEGFKNGRHRVLVATDVAARGIDVHNISLVVNYDLPDAAEDYVHRIGRTGRAGKEGKAISFATPDQRRDVQTIERLIQKSLPVSKHSHAPAMAARTERSDRRFEGSGNPRNQGYRGKRRQQQARWSRPVPRWS